MIMDATHCIRFSVNLSPLLWEAMYENIMECLFWFLNHIDWIVASRKQFKCNCIYSTFVKRKKSKVPKRFHMKLATVIASLCHKGSSVQYCDKNCLGFVKIGACEWNTSPFSFLVFPIPITEIKIQKTKAHCITWQNHFFTVHSQGAVFMERNGNVIGHIPWHMSRSLTTHLNSSISFIRGHMRRVLKWELSKNQS